MTVNELILLYTERKAYAKGGLDAISDEITPKEKALVDALVRLLEEFVEDLKKIKCKERN